MGPDGNVLLHRAFSVFLFNKRGDMLLQRRASQKVRLFTSYRYIFLVFEVKYSYNHFHLRVRLKFLYLTHLDSEQKCANH